MINTNIEGITLTTDFTQRDIDYSIKRHIEIFDSEYGFSREFNNNVTKLIKSFGENYNPDKEFMLIAKENGKFAGTITVLCQEEGKARLRYFFVEPFTRGKGVGRLLFTTAMNMAKEKGCTHAYFSTYNVLKPARTMYRHLGFEITHTQPDDDVAAGVVEEIWEKDL